MKHPEHPYPPESFRAGAREREPDQRGLSETHVARIFHARREMLGSILDLISPSFAEALRQKIDYEHARLREFADETRRAQRERARQSSRLHAQYFTLTPLEIDLL